MMTAAELEALYGQPDAAYFSEYCIMWEVQQDYPWFPAKVIYINKDFKVVFSNGLLAVQTAGLQGEIITFDGCFNERNVRGSTSISAHYYACACDLNASKNPMAVNPTPAQRQGSWTPEFIVAMKSAGLFFGGDFHTRADPMHWSYADM
jgi:hypothetical protein